MSYQWLLTLGFGACALSAVGLSQGSAQNDDTACTEKKCHLVGTLRLEGDHDSGQLDTSAACYDLALPKEVVDHPSEWTQKRVQLDGELLSRPSNSRLIWIDLRDRRVGAGGCGTGTVYVNSIKLAPQ